MLQKNIEKLNRKQKRKPPIPYTRKGPTKQGRLISAITKHKERMYG